MLSQKVSLQIFIWDVTTMRYNKLLIDPNGEEFPYTESLDDAGEKLEYHYQVSVIWQNRDAQLNINRYGVHLAFDDDGSWLDFHTVPEKLFPKQHKLSEQDLLTLITKLETTIKTTLYTKEQIDVSHQQYLKR